jgi:hypothetical protein
MKILLLLFAALSLRAETPRPLRCAVNCRWRSAPTGNARFASHPICREAEDPAFTMPGELVKAGVKIAFGSFGPTASDHPRNLPYQAATAVAFGLPYEEALKAVTLNVAEIWGVAEKTQVNQKAGGSGW